MRYSRHVNTVMYRIKLTSHNIKVIEADTELLPVVVCHNLFDEGNFLIFMRDFGIDKATLMAISFAFAVEGRLALYGSSGQKNDNLIKGM